MNPIEELKQEHEDIERELLELETISQEEIINYPNLLHVFNKLHDIWNQHENKENRIFPILRKREKLIIPVDTLLFEHKQLRKHKEAIKKAIESGSEEKVKQVLQNDGKIIIARLRSHIKLEDEILYRIVLEEMNPDEIREMKIALS